MPLKIRLRQSLQLAWTSRPQLDKALEMTALSDLNDWIEDFNNVEQPRTYFRPQLKATDIQLHGLSDVSELSLASIAYLKIAYNDNTVDLKFKIGKARVSLIKRMTIPNLLSQTSQVCERPARHHNQQLETLDRQHNSSPLGKLTQSAPSDLHCQPL